MKSYMVLARWVKRTLDYGWQIIQDLPWHRRFDCSDMPPFRLRVWEQARLLYTSGINGEDYYHHGLYRPEVPFSEKAKFLGFYRCSRYYQIVNPERFDLLARDKVIFHMLATALELPVPQLVAVTRSDGEPLFGHTLKTREELEKFLRDDNANNLFIKPAGGKGGEGAMSLGDKLPGLNAWRKLPSEDEVTLDQVMSHICLEDHQMERFLFQKRLKPHAVLNAIIPDVCSTVRLMTFIEGFQVTVMGAALRLGNGKDPTDNISGGGVIVAINMDDGRLGRVVNLENDLPKYMWAHPANGVVVSGTTLPDWPEVVQLVNESARKLAFIPCIGWDIALTDEGPLIVEINSRPRCRPIQIANDSGLLVGPFRDALIANNGTINSGLHLSSV